MNARLLTCCAVALCAVLAACGGMSSSSGPRPVPCPLAAGQNAIPAGPELLYPVPDSTGAPDGNFTLVVAFGAASPPPLEIVPASGGAAIAGGAWGPAPSPLPSPTATPHLPYDTLYASAVPPLTAHTTYNAQVTFGAPPCQTTETAGSFTTQ